MRLYFLTDTWYLIHTYVYATNSNSLGKLNFKLGWFLESELRSDLCGRMNYHQHISFQFICLERSCCLFQIIEFPRDRSQWSDMAIHLVECRGVPWSAVECGVLSREQVFHFIVRWEGPLDLSWELLSRFVKNARLTDLTCAFPPWWREPKWINESMNHWRIEELKLENESGTYRTPRNVT